MSEEEIAPYAAGKGGYETALATGLLATNCCVCGRPLLDADSVQRGYGPDCRDKYMMPDRMTEQPDRDLMRQAFEVAPGSMRTALTKVAPVSHWDDADVRQKLVNVATFHAALAVSYGGNTKLTNENGIDTSKLVIAAFQALAMGAGYSKLATRLIATFASRGQAADAPADIRIHYASDNRKMMKLAAPYSETFNAAARKSGLFGRFEKVGRDFWRFFKTDDLAKVLNLLQSAFGDQLLEGPEKTLGVLPAVPLFIPPDPTPPAPPPDKATNAPASELPVSVQEIRVGDEVELPDGRVLTVGWVGMGRGQKSVGVGPRGRYEFFSISVVKLMSPAAATAVLKEGAADAAADAKRQGVSAPALPTKVTREVPATCFDYQIEGIRWLDEKGRGILADDMGLGKSLQSIVALDPPALVVCPAKLKVNWMKELGKWRSELTSQIISGTTPVKAEDLRAQVIIVNYDLLAAHQEVLASKKWKTIIFDEAQALKNMDVRWDKTERRMMPGSKGPQRARAAYEIWRGANRVFILTGTPIMNRVRELWPLLHLVDPKEWYNFFEFGKYFCAGYEQPIGRGRTVWNFNGRSNVAELHDRINGKYMLRRMKVDVLKDLPEKSRFTTSVSLDDATAKKYTKAADDFIRWVESHGGPQAVEKALRAEALTRMTALRRIAAEGKVEAALEWIWSYYDSRRQPLLVWGWHKEPLVKMAAELAQGEKDDEERPPLRVATIIGGTSDKAVNETKERFQAGEIDVLLMSIALGSGHTLTAATDALFIERAWRPSDLAQAEDRIYRIGQKNAVRITYLDAEGTIDAAISELLADKAKTSAGVIDGKDLDDDDAVSTVLHSIFGIRNGRVRNSPRARTGRTELPFSWNDPL